MTTQLIDLSDLKKSYYALISQYVFLLSYAAEGRIYGLTRQMIEDHIRVNLREIIEAFTLYEHALWDRVPKEDLSWIHQEREYLTGLMDQLSNLRQQLLTYGWRFLALFWANALLEFTRGTDPTETTRGTRWVLNNLSEIFETLTYNFGLLLVIGTITFMVIMGVCFLQKRMCLEGLYDRSRMSIPETDQRPITYVLENNLFKWLERKKPREMPWDAWAILVGGIAGSALIVGVLSGFVGFWEDPQGLKYALMLVALIAGITYAAISHQLDREYR